MSDINWKKLSEAQPTTEGVYLVEIKDYSNIRYEVLKFKKELYRKNYDTGHFTIPVNNLFCSQIYPPNQHLTMYRDDNGHWFYGVPGHVVRYALIAQ